MWSIAISLQGLGNFHTGILYSEKDKVVAEKITLDLQRRAIEMEGTVTGEHGIGLALRDVLEEELGENATDMMRKVSWPTTMSLPSDGSQIKFALDPYCLLNCDKIIRMEPVTHEDSRGELASE